MQNSYQIPSPISTTPKSGSFHPVKLSSQQFSLKNRRVSMKPYYYNELGNICLNLVSPLISSTTSPGSPLKYRTLGSKFEEFRSKSVKNQSKTIKNEILPRKIKLKSSLHSKEVFVMQSGSDIQGEISGFSYLIPRHRANQNEKKEEMTKFFHTCQKHFKKSKPFKFIFSTQGKIYQSLQEIPYTDKVIFVGCDPELKHLNDQDFFHDSNLRKSVYSSLESKFSTITSHLNVQQNNLVYSKTLKKPSTAQNKFLSRVSKNELKYILGQTSVRLDTEFPKLCDLNIEKISQSVMFSYSEIYKLYAKFKTLVQMSMAQNPNHQIKSGIIKETFIQSYFGSKDLNFVLGRIFDCIDHESSGTMSWEKYLSAMNLMYNGSYDEKIDFLFRIFDTDNNGKLKFKEIKTLCRLQLQNSESDDVIDELSQSFAGLVYNTSGISHDKEISGEEIKNVLNKNTDNSLIEMFCSFNFIKL